MQSPALSSDHRFNANRHQMAPGRHYWRGGESKAKQPILNNIHHTIPLHHTCNANSHNNNLASEDLV